MENITEIYSWSKHREQLNVGHLYSADTSAKQPTPKAQGVLEEKGWKEFKSQRTRKAALDSDFLI